MSHICSAQCESAGAGKREKRAWHRPGSPHSEKPAGNRQGMHWPPQSLSLLSPRAHKAPADPGESQPQGCLRSCPRGPPGGLNRLRRRRWREQGMPGRASGRAAVTHPKETIRRDSSGVQGRGGRPPKCPQSAAGGNSTRCLQNLPLAKGSDVISPLPVSQHRATSQWCRQARRLPSLPSFLSSHQSGKEREKPTETPSPLTSTLVPGKGGQGGRTNSG